MYFFKKINLAMLFLLLSNCSNHAHQTHNMTSTLEPSISHELTLLLKESVSINTSTKIATLSQAIVKNSNAPEPLFNLAYAHMVNAKTNNNGRERDLAIIYFNKTLLLAPGNHAIINALYSIYYDDTLKNRHADSFELAKKNFLQISDKERENLNPPSLAKFAALSVLQEKQKETNHQALREILLEAIQEQPLNDISYIQLAKLYADDRYFTLAIATLKLAEENIHDSHALLNAIASTYEDRAERNDCSYENPKDLNSASEYYKLAIPLKPENTETHNKLSGILFDQNLNKLALNEIDIALSLSPTEADYSLAAQYYSALGNNIKSSELLETAKQKGFTANNTTQHEIVMNKGDWATAEKTFAAYINNQKSHSIYDLIKSDIIATQTQHTPILSNKNIITSSDWEEKLLSYWSEKTTDAELKKSAFNSCRKTEYYFYTGYRDLQQGNTALAKHKFSTAIEQNTYRFIERPWARYFLQHN